jgi:hypothetical protein
MSRYLHTIDMINGSQLADPTRLRVGLLSGVAVTGPTGPLTEGTVETQGAGYTAIPTITAAGGTGAAIAATMGLDSIALNAAGGSSSYVVGDTITLSGGTETTNAVVEVISTLLASATIGGTMAGYVVGDFVTFAPTGGTQLSPVTIKVSTVSTGAIATFSLIATGCSKGQFTANPTGFTQLSTTGVGTGATLTSPLYGVDTFDITNPGVYSVLPSSFTQGSTSGSGAGATFNTPLWHVAAISAVGGEGYANGAALTGTGGSPTTAFTGFGTTEEVGEEVQIVISATQPSALGGGLSGLPTNYAVFVTPNAPCGVLVSNKTNGGFTITLSPAVAGTGVEASLIDILVVG